MPEKALEAHTDHLCVLAILARRLAETRDGDRAALAADAVAALARGGQFDRCCVPRYLALAPERAPAEVQIPIVEERDIATRVIVWPIGARDAAHAHVDGWAVFAPMRGTLEGVVEHDGRGPSLRRFATGRPRILRPDDPVEHRLRNAGDDVALSIHVFGTI